MNKQTKRPPFREEVNAIIDENLPNAGWILKGDKANRRFISPDTGEEMTRWGALWEQNKREGYVGIAFLILLFLLLLILVLVIVAILRSMR
jgi:hypothetical protein